MTGIAWAADAPAAGGMGAIAQFVPLILIFVVFYFLLIRPQQKKAKAHQNYLTNLKKGDRVVTGGGIHGQITGLTDSVVTLEIAENVRIKLNRGAIGGSVADMDKQAPLKAGG
ncbi:MAG: preprotein translocase subunit YajC [Desulfobulbus sp.]|jgi:preprotein translocase subunit YajC|nr:preprotein translocase subunit YajC [Desulfobulbus sp.]